MCVRHEAKRAFELPFGILGHAANLTGLTLRQVSNRRPLQKLFCELNQLVAKRLQQRALIVIVWHGCFRDVSCLYSVLVATPAEQQQGLKLKLYLDATNSPAVRATPAGPTLGGKPSSSVKFSQKGDQAVQQHHSELVDPVPVF